MSTPPAYRGSDPFIFVCYAHSDREVVYTEIERLNSEGFNLWYDEGIEPGSEWSAAIAEAIEKCTVFLYFVSPGAVDSEHCRREVNFALEQHCALLAVHLEPTDMPSALKLSLSNRQAILKHSDERYAAKLSSVLSAALSGLEPVEHRSMTIGAYSLDIDTRTLAGTDTQTSLDPKELAVLLHLADSAPGVVATEELLSRNWPGSVVGDNALQQVIGRLRRAFDDDARNPSYIETQSRRGYRLMVVPQVVEPQTSKKPGKQRQWILAAVLLLVVALGIVAFVSTQPAKLPEVANTDDDVTRIAVLPLNNRSGRSDIGVIAGGLAEELTRQISGWGGFVAQPLVFHEHGDILLLDPDIDLAIDGSIHAEEDEVEIYIRLIDLDLKEAVWEHKFKGSLQDPRALEYEIGSQVAFQMSETFVWGIDPPQSLAAYPLYLEWARNQWLGAADDHIGLLERIVAIDPSWTWGWAQLAWVMYRSGSWNRDSSYFEQANEIFDANVPTEHAAHIVVGSFRDFYWEDQLNAAFDSAVAMSHAGFAFSYVWFMSSSGMHAEVEQHTERVLDIEPYSHADLQLNALARENLGDFEGTLDTVRRLAAMFPGNASYANAFRTRALPESGALEETRKLLAQLRQDLVQERRPLHKRNMEKIVIRRLAFELAMAEGDRDTAYENIDWYIEQNMNLFAGMLYLRTGDERAEQYLGMKAIPEFDRWEWAMLTVHLDPEHKRNPLFVDVENRLGFTQEWRLRLCKEISEFQNDLMLQCNPEDYAVRGHVNTNGP